MDLRIFYLCAALLASLSLSSCAWSEPKVRSVLVIAAEDLGFGAVPCATENENTNDNDRQSGFEILCQEAVRFTHAYTTSTMSVPALASLLTGRYPHEHLVRDNGSTFLSARFESAAEAAIVAGFRTAFFGGGPPVWRNSGLNQGFETFDDGASPGSSLFRPVSEIVKQYLDWRAAEPRRRPTFAVLHLADSQFTEVPTTNDLGEVRPSSYRGQVEEIDETLGKLFRVLREQGSWDTTAIFVVGLAGHVTEPRYQDPRETNVYSERTRVALFAKPARKARESSFNWKVDPNVSLADVGATLYEMLGRKFVASNPATVSLLKVLERPEPDWDEDRLVMTESSWAYWRGLSGRRFAMRKGPFLYLHDGPGRLFNTLTDNLETSPLPASDLRYWEVRAPFDAFAAELGLLPWVKLAPSTVSRLDIGRDLWRGNRSAEEVMPKLRKLAHANPLDVQLQGWRAMFALRSGQWMELKDAGWKTANPVWNYVAAANLGEPRIVPEDTCFRLFSSATKSKAPTLRECPSREILELYSWVDETQPAGSKQTAMERFFRLYGESLLEERIAIANYATGLVWDVPLHKPDGPRLTDLILSLPELKRYRAQVDRRFLRENK